MAGCAFRITATTHFGGPLRHGRRRRTGMIRVPCDPFHFCRCFPFHARASSMGAPEFEPVPRPPAAAG